MKRSHEFILIAHLASILFALVAIIVKYLTLPIALIAWGRSLSACIGLMIYFLCTRQSLKLNSRKHYLVLVILGLIQTAQWLTIFYAIYISNVSYALIALYTFPLFVTIFEPLVFKEKFQQKAFMAALVVMLGVLMVMPEMSFKNHYVIGIFWGTTSAILVAIMLLMHRKFIQHYSSTKITFYKTGVASVVLMPLILDFNKSNVEQEQIILIIFMGIFCTAIPFVLIIKSFKYLKAQQASLILSMELVYGILLAYLLFNEEQSMRTITGALLIIGATVAIKKQ